MKSLRTIRFLVSAALLALAAVAKPRLFVLTDLANEPDDEESLVRLLVCSNEFDIEGLVATTSCYPKKGPYDAKGEVHVILRVRDSGSPAMFAYRRIVAEVEPDRMDGTSPL